MLRFLFSLIVISLCVFTTLSQSLNYDAERIRISSIDANNPDVSESGTAINNNGTVLGGRVVQFGSTSSYHGYTYSPTALLSSLPGAFPIRLNVFQGDINDNGLSVGSCRYFEAEFMPCYWYGGTIAQPIGLTGGYLTGNSTAVNNSGQAVGYFRNSLGNPTGLPVRAFIWDAVNGVRIFPEYPGQTTQAFDINNNGQVVGCRSDGVTGHGFIWDAQNGMRSLESYIGGTAGWDSFECGSKINDQGHVAGTGLIGGQRRNFYYDGSVVYFMGDPLDYEIRGLNNAGQIVGMMSTEEGSHAFYWDVNVGLEDLNDHVREYGWTWFHADDIDENGKILVTGIKSDIGLERTWIFTPGQEKPLIFIPGIGGSTLHEKNQDGSAGANIWMDGVLQLTTLYKLSLDPGAQNLPEIVAVKPIESFDVAGITLYPVYDKLLEALEQQGDYHKYNINGDPRKNFPGTNGCTGQYSGRKPNLFLFPYDWRLSNAQAAEKLKSFVDCVRLFYPHQDQKIDILTHSMGGLVARRYVLNNEDHRVSKMVTMMAPWLGAPLAIDSMTTGRFVGLSRELGGGVYIQETPLRSVARYGKGPHELLPSYSYFALGGRPLAYKDFLNFTWTEYDYDQSKAFLKKRHAPADPYANNDSFHNHVNIDQDNWGSDDSRIKYYHFYGKQNCDLTPGRIGFKALVSFPLVPNQMSYTTDITWTSGDGTVPTFSAGRPSSMLSPTTMVQKMLQPSQPGCSYLFGNDKEFEHNGILQTQLAFDEIFNALGRETVQRPVNNTAKQPANVENNFGSGDGLNYLSISGVDRLDIFDDQGNTNTPVNDEVDAAVDGVRYEYGSTSGAELIVPHQVFFYNGKTVDIKFTSTGEKVSINLHRGSNPNAATSAIKYLDVDLPVGVKAWLRFDGINVDNLKADLDSDDKFETEILPDFNITGVNASDIEDPMVNVSYGIENNEATVSVNATDAQSGINQVRYIASGESTDHIYTGSFTFTMNQSNLFYFAAQDNAGNRSVLAKFIDPVAPTSTVTHNAPPNSAGWNTSDTTFEIKALDDIGGSGLKELTLSADGTIYIPEQKFAREYPPMAMPQPSTVNDHVTKTFNMFREGVTNFYFYGKDREGNIEELKTYTVKVDKGRPFTRHELVVNSQVTTVTLTANDYVSGVAETRYRIDGGAEQIYTGPFDVSNSGGHSVSYYSVDVAGNQETPGVININAEDVPKSVLVSEFRTRGALGADDEFIELYNNSDTEVDISAWEIKTKQGSGSAVTLATINSATTIPARGHYLLRKDGTSNYSLGSYAEADQTYTGSLPDNVGIALFSDNSVIIDAVGFSSVTDSTYREGTGLVPSSGITTDGQYSFIRNFSASHLPVDSNNNRTDFIFIATDGNTYNNLKAVLGTPGPENLNSPVYREGEVIISQLDTSVTLAELPNRFYDYTETDPLYPVGTLAIRRMVINNTANTLTEIRLRITALTTKNSAVIFPQQAFLRLLNSSDITVDVEGYPAEVKGLTIEPAPSSSGGLNSSLILNLGKKGLQPGQSLNFNLKTGIVTNGQYKLEIRAEGF